MLITCSSEGTAVSDCNIDLFKQSGITYNSQVDGPVCLNPAQNIADESAPPYFKACAGAAYTYPNDNKVTVSNLKNNLVSCYIGMSCQASLRQLLEGGNSINIQIRNDESRAEKTYDSPSLTLPLAHELDHYYYLPRFHVHRKVY